MIVTPKLLLLLTVYFLCIYSLAMAIQKLRKKPLPLKLLAGSVVGAIFIFFLVVISANNSAAMRHPQIITPLVTFFCGFSGFLIGAYFHLRLRLKLTPQEAWDLKIMLQMPSRTVEGIILGVAFGYVFGLVACWIVIEYAALWVLVLASILLGGILGFVGSLLLNFISNYVKL